MEECGDSAEFISYNHDTFEWVFKAPHFTKYGEDEEEIQEDQPVDTLKKAA